MELEEFINQSTYQGCVSAFWVLKNQKIPNFRFFKKKSGLKIEILDSSHSRKMLSFSLISCVYSYAIYLAVCWMHVKAGY